MLHVMYIAIASYTSWAGPIIMWQSQVENEQYSTASGPIQLVISLECFVEITPDFLCPLWTTCTVNFGATASGSL